MVLSQVVVSSGLAMAQGTPTSFQGLLEYLKISEPRKDLKEQGLNNLNVSDLVCLSQDDLVELEVNIDQCNQVTEWQALLQHTAEFRRPKAGQATTQLAAVFSSLALVRPKAESGVRNLAATN